MTEGPPIPAATPPPEGERWRPRLRWFGAEFLVVVAGILAALAINAWWGARDDASRERRYLTQLRSDLLETERLVAEADSVMGPVDAAGAQLARAFFLPDRPPADSIVVWFSRAYRVRDARPITGTVESLIATGDLGLLRDESLRSAVATYLDNTRTTIRIHDQDVQRWVDALLAFSTRLNPLQLEEALADPSTLDSLRSSPLWTLPQGAHRDPFPLDVDELLSERPAYDEVKQMHLSKETLRVMRSRMRADAEQLRARVEEALDR